MVKGRGLLIEYPRAKGAAGRGGVGTVWKSRAGVPRKFHGSMAGVGGPGRRDGIYQREEEEEEEEGTLHPGSYPGELPRFVP